VAIAATADVADDVLVVGRKKSHSCGTPYNHNNSNNNNKSGMSSDDANDSEESGNQPLCRSY